MTAAIRAPSRPLCIVLCCAVVLCSFPIIAATAADRSWLPGVARTAPPTARDPASPAESDADVRAVADQTCDCRREQCVTLGQQVTLRGRIADEVHFGPPAEGEDAMLVAYVIVPARPLCLQRSGSGPDVENITRVQIAGDLGTKRAPEQVGRDVVARGVLFEPETGYHYTPVLIHITDSTPARARPHER